jgi:hypothetical protein
MGDMLAMQTLGVGEKIEVKILISCEVEGSGVWCAVRATGSKGHGRDGEQVFNR